MRIPCPEAISMPATLYLYGQRVRIVAGRYERTSPKVFCAGEFLVAGAPRGEVAAVSGKRGQALSETQQLLELGEPAIRYLTEIVLADPAVVPRMSIAAPASAETARKFCGVPWKKA